MTVTLGDIERSPREYVLRVQAGETFVITEAERPVAELKPVEVAGNGLRPFGLFAGELPFRIGNRWRNNERPGTDYTFGLGINGGARARSIDPPPRDV